MGDKRTILIVDDEVDLSTLVKIRLEEKDYYVLLACNGVEGLEILESVTPDLILLDVNMPKMGGLEFYSKISTVYGRSKYPVLMLTSRASLEETFRDIDVAGFLPKPFEINELISEVERILTADSQPIVFLLDASKTPYLEGIIDVFERELYKIVHVENFEQLQDKYFEFADAQDFSKTQGGSAGKRTRFILLEYLQKETRGEELIKEIKNNPLFQGAPVLVYSYSGLKGYAEKSVSAGADKYLGKPEDFGAFVRAVREIELKDEKRWFMDEKM